MDINEIKSVLDQCEDYLKRGRLRNAANLQKQLAINIGSNFLLDKVNFQIQSYEYLLQYFIEGVDDPKRKELFDDIRLNLFTVNDLFRRENAKSYQPFHRYIDYYSDLKLEFDLNKLIEKRKRDFPELDIEYYPLEESILEEFFVNIWLYPDLTQEDYDKFKDFFKSEAHWVQKSLAVSALTLGLLNFFCPRKVLLLFDIILTEQEQIWERAFVGLMIILMLYDKRIKFYPEIVSRIKTFPEIPAFKPKLKAIIIQLIRSAVETQKIQERFEKEILPEMERISPKIADKLDLDSLASEDMFDEENPDWSKLVPEEEDLLNKMSEFSMLQMEGADVLHSAFSQMKHFPFFNKISNWFLPFYKDNENLKQKFIESGMNAEDAQTLIDALEQARYMCNSDKYSFAFQIDFFPTLQRESIIQLFKMEAQAAKEVMEDEKITDPLGNSRRIIIQYVQDLYRFFKLYRYRGILPDIFDELSFHDKEFFRLIADDEIYKEIGDFYFSKKFYPFALDVFQIIEQREPEKDPQILEKIGFVYQKLKNYSKALEYYRKAELFEPEKKWLIKKIAFTSMKIGDYERAIDYYLKVLDQDPDNHKVILNIANCYLNLGDYDKALQHYYKVDYYSPDNPKVIRPIAWINFHIGKLDKAEKYYEKLIPSGAKPIDLIIAGHIKWIKKQNKQALELYHRAFEEYTSKQDFENDFFEDKDILLKHNISSFDMNLMFDAAIA